jgi:hypothetical protein
MDISDKLVAAAMKNLEKLLISKGFTAESLISKFDFDGDGVININEFDAGLTKLTGSSAPRSYLGPIFSSIDTNDDGFLDSGELIALLGIENQTTVNSSSIIISGHVNEKYNGEYSIQPSQINDKNWYMNSNNCRLYFYNANDGGAPSWSLDDREQDGSNDWYGGGWTRVPADGNIPIGVRRFVGAGKITISASSVSENNNVQKLADSNESQIPSEEIEVIEPEFDMNTFVDKWMEELEKMLENPSSPEFIDNIHSESNKKFEQEVSQLPLFTQAPVRAIWKIKSDAVVTVAKTQLSGDSAKIATGLGVLGAVGGLAAQASVKSEAKEAVMKEKFEDTPSIPEEVSNAQSWHDSHQVDAPERVEVVDQMSSEEWGREHNVDAPERVELPDRVTVSEPLSYSGKSSEVENNPIKSNIDTKISPPPSPKPESDSISSLEEIISEMNGARFLNDQRELLSGYKGQNLELTFRVSSVDRTFGIGISDEYKGGETLLVTSDSHEIEVRVKKDVDTDKILSGTEMNSIVSVADWNGIRKRLVVNLH